MARYHRIVRCVSLLFFVLCASHDVTGQDSREPIAAVLAALANYEQSCYYMEASASVELLDGGMVSASERQVLRYRIGPDQALLSQKKVTIRPDREPARIQVDLRLFPDGNVLSLQSRIDGSPGQDVSDDSRNGLLLWSHDIAGNQVVDRNTVYNRLGDSTVMFWWIGRTPLAMYLSENATVEPSDDGKLRIFSLSSYGDAMIEVSPESGWMPEKFRITKTPNDLCIKGTVREWFMPEAEESDHSDIYPPGKGPPPTAVTPQVKSVEWEGDARSFKHDSTGRWFAEDFEITSTVNFMKQPPQRIRTTIDVDAFEFSDGFDHEEFRSDLVFPAGTRVTIADAEHLPYIWDGTRPVPGIPAPINSASGVEVLDENARKKTSDSFWLFVINGAMIVSILTAVWVRKRLRNREKVAR